MFFVLPVFERDVIVVGPLQSMAAPELSARLILGNERIAEFSEKAEETLKVLK